MSYLDSLKAFTTEQVVKLMVNSLRNASDENIIRLTYLAEKLTLLSIIETKFERFVKCLKNKDPR